MIWSNVPIWGCKGVPTGKGLGRSNRCTFEGKLKTVPNRIFFCKNRKKNAIIGSSMTQYVLFIRFMGFDTKRKQVVHICFY